jgi:hypothetical protein
MMRSGERLDQVLLTGLVLSSAVSVGAFLLGVGAEPSENRVVVENIGRIGMLLAVCFGQLRVYTLVTTHRRVVTKNHDELITGLAELLASDRRNTTTMLLKVEEGIRAEVRAASPMPPPVERPASQGGVVIPMFPEAAV